MKNNPLPNSGPFSTENFTDSLVGWKTASITISTENFTDSLVGWKTASITTDAGISSSSSSTTMLDFTMPTETDVTHSSSPSLTQFNDTVTTSTSTSISAASISAASISAASISAAATSPASISAAATSLAATLEASTVGSDDDTVVAGEGGGL